MKWSNRAVSVVGCLVASVIGIAGIAVAVYFGVRQTPQKSVQWVIDTRGMLVTVNDNWSSSGSIQIYFDGQVVDDVEFLELTFTNTGGIPLQRVDFVSPLHLSFGANAKIYSARISSRRPESLQVSLFQEGERLLFQQDLINPGESFSVQIVGSSLPSFPFTGGRIVGLADIPIFTPFATETPLWQLAGFVVRWTTIAVCVLMIVATLLAKLMSEGNPPAWRRTLGGYLFSAAIALGVVLAIIVLLSWYEDYSHRLGLM